MAQLGVIGECMLEFRESEGGGFQLGYGGDAFNTAVYAARLGIEVGFVSAIGDDHYSDWLLAQWHEEGVDCRHVRQLGGRAPALYLIRNDEAGERYFHYWRDASPFRSLLSGADPDGLERLLGQFDWIYLTGIGLALLPADDRALLLDCISSYREGGGKVAFDPNYRPMLWQDLADAVHWIDRAYGQADLLLPSLDDELALRAPARRDDIVRRLAQSPAPEVVIKDGAAGCRVRHGQGIADYPLTAPVAAVDTTAAGDSFNAGYLQARLSGGTVAAAVAAGQTLAGRVVAVKGAIIPLSRMP